MTETTEFNFADLTIDQLAFIDSVEIDEYVVTRDVMNQIKDNLELVGKSFTELQAIRNSVVRYLADLGDKARELGAWSLFDKSRTNMSGITAVIDELMFAAR